MEADWPMIVVLALATALTVYIGRLWFKRWFNPLSTYSALWGFCLGTYELKLIQYYPVSTSAWLYILAAWMSLYFGALTALIILGHSRIPARCTDEKSVKLIRQAIIALSVIGALAVARQMQILTREFGGVITAVLASGNEIYLGKLTGELAFFPYIGSVLYAGCALSGVYTARIGKLTLVSSVPIVLIAFNNALSMIRAGVIMAAFLFLAGFLLTPGARQLTIKRWQATLGAGVAVSVLLGGFFLVSSTRGLAVDFPGITPAMDQISSYVPFFPSVYSNVSATPVALSLYLSAPVEDKNGVWGQYTFAPLLRVLAKTGLVRERERYEEEYYTPVPTNTSTYLKDLDSDFGFVGILGFPYFLGMAMTLLILGLERVPKLTYVILLSNLYLLILSSFAVNLMVLGDWYMSTFVGVVVGAIIDRRTVFLSPPKAWQRKLGVS